MRPTMGVSMIRPKKEHAELAEDVLLPLEINAAPGNELCEGVLSC